MTHSLASNMPGNFVRRSMFLLRGFLDEVHRCRGFNPTRPVKLEFNHFGLWRDGNACNGSSGSTVGLLQALDIPRSLDGSVVWSSRQRVSRRSLTRNKRWVGAHNNFSIHRHFQGLRMTLPVLTILNYPNRPTPWLRMAVLR